MAIPTQEPFQESIANSYGYFNYGGNIAINIDDLLFRDPVDGNVKPMAYLTGTNYSSLSDRWLLQRYAKKYFAGVAGFAKLSTDPAQANVLVKTDLCTITNLQASNTANVGDLLAVGLASGNAGCLSDTVYNLSSDNGGVDPALAIGKVVTDELYSTAGTKVKARLVSTLINHGQSNLVEMGSINAVIPFGSVASITGTGPYTGTYTFAQKLPAGAVVTCWQALVTTAFAGTSVTAVTMTIGVSGTANAFSQTTNGSIFATGPLSSDTPIATGMQASEVAPLVTFTITGGNTLSAGSVTIALKYICPLSP